MAATNWYVDPLSGSNANDGTSDAQAWETLQYALDNYTPTANDGDIINIKDSATIQLSANLDYSNVTSSVTTPFCMRGYTSSAGDGGRCTIDVQTYTFMFTTLPIILVDMIFTNTSGSNNGYISIYSYSTVKRCKFHSLSHGLRIGGTNCRVLDSEFTDVGNYFIENPGTDYILIRNNYFYNSGTRTPSSCIDADSSSNYIYVHNNIFHLDSTTHGVNGNSANLVFLSFCNNTCLTSGTGDAVKWSHGSYSSIVEDNIFEGWNTAVNFDNSDNRFGASLSNNHFYDNSTDIGSTTYTTFIITEDNFLSSAESVLAKTGSPTFANRFSYFAPIGDAIGNASNGNSDIGAVKGAGSSGGLLRQPGMGGGFNT